VEPGSCFILAGAEAIFVKSLMSTPEPKEAAETAYSHGGSDTRQKGGGPNKVIVRSEQMLPIKAASAAIHHPLDALPQELLLPAAIPPQCPPL